MFYGSTRYEEVVKIPMVTKDGLGGGISDRPVVHRDIARSIMDFLGFERIPLHAGRLSIYQRMFGLSL